MLRFVLCTIFLIVVRVLLNDIANSCSAVIKQLYVYSFFVKSNYQINIRYRCPIIDNKERDSQEKHSCRHADSEVVVDYYDDNIRSIAKHNETCDDQENHNILGKKGVVEEKKTRKKIADMTKEEQDHTRKLSRERQRKKRMLDAQKIQMR
jgi:hypothetical protein